MDRGAWLPAILLSAALWAAGYAVAHAVHSYWESEYSGP